jgi:ssDNA-binding Zn-finger/Zn-ribbon topoisomerase 1
MTRRIVYRHEPLITAAEGEIVIQCRQCKKDFIHERQRGRVPVRCPECRETNPVEPKPERNLDPEVVCAAYKARIAELKEEYGGDIFAVPRAKIAKAQEELRRAWCEAYGKPWDR